MKTLDEAGIGLKLKKCNVAQEQTELLGFTLTQSGIKPIDEKIQTITNRIKPKNLKELCLFMGAINQMNRFIPNLAQLCAPLRPLLSKENEWIWTKTHDRAFGEIKKAIQ